MSSEPQQDASRPMGPAGGDAGTYGGPPQPGSPSGPYGPGRGSFAPPPPPPPPPPGAAYRQPGPPPPPPPPARSTRVGCWILLLLLMGSVFVNIVLVYAVGKKFQLSTVRASEANDGLQQVIYEDGDSSNRVALVRIQGIITQSPSDSFDGGSGADYYYVRAQVERVLDDSRVKAVVLQVDSPGGGATASDMMLNELKRITGEGKKPIIVHMGGVAASGGYYVSMAGKKIIAQPTCITGSIGVVAQFLSLEGLMNDKLGIKTYTLKSGEYKDVGNLFRDMEPEEKTYLEEKLLTPIYKRFVDMVLEGRPKLTREDVIGFQAGIFTAEDAQKAGLIDDIGYLGTAIDAAAKEAGITYPQVVQYQRRVNFWDLLGMDAAAARSPMLKLDRTTLNSLGTAEVMMIWKP